MKYYREIHFIDQHWHRFVFLMSNKKQRANTAGCLELLTDAANVIKSLEGAPDDHINARVLLYAIRKYLHTCTDEKERLRCVHVMLLSLHCHDAKSRLCEQWGTFYRLGHPTLTDAVSCYCFLFP